MAAPRPCPALGDSPTRGSVPLGQTLCNHTWCCLEAGSHRSEMRKRDQERYISRDIERDREMRGRGRCERDTRRQREVGEEGTGEGEKERDRGRERERELPSKEGFAFQTQTRFPCAASTPAVSTSTSLFGASVWKGCPPVSPLSGAGSKNELCHLLRALSCAGLLSPHRPLSMPGRPTLCYT